MGVGSIIKFNIGRSIGRGEHWEGIALGRGEGNFGRQEHWEGKHCMGGGALGKDSIGESQHWGEPALGGGSIGREEHWKGEHCKGDSIGRGSIGKGSIGKGFFVFRREGEHWEGGALGGWSIEKGVLCCFFLTS